jgi:hypothetical protein
MRKRVKNRETLFSRTGEAVLAGGDPPTESLRSQSKPHIRQHSPAAHHPFRGGLF